jgi:hypothetical protein
VPESPERSNVRVFPAWPGRRRKLLPLATQDDSPHAALAAIEARLAETMLPFDVAMLGMGSDDLKNAPRSLWKAKMAAIP